MKRIPAVILLLVTAFTSLSGQEPDTGLVFQNADTIYRFGEDITRLDTMVVPVSAVEAKMEKDPLRAIMLAMALPGLGQVYNEKYWKLPFVYGAIGGAGYAIAYNSEQYRQAIEAYTLEPNDTNEWYLGQWRRYVEISYIAMVAVYGLQILDAYVDAMLFTWEVDDQLSIRVAPTVRPLLTPGQAPSAFYGLNCGFTIGRRR